MGYNTAREQAKHALEANNVQAAMAIIDNWNAKAEKILPDILPYLAQDDPQEAQKLHSSVTFQMQDIARMQRSVYDKLSSVPAPKSVSGTGKTPSTMGQMFPNQAMQQSDLRQMRQSP